MAAFQSVDPCSHSSQMKRPRGSPAGITPLQDLKKLSPPGKAVSRQRVGAHLSSKRNLPFSRTTSYDWTELEDSTLVLFTRPGPSWPTEKGLEFWDLGAAKYVHTRSESNLQQTGV